MILAILYGLVAGILLCLTFGTVFFSLLQNSVDNGYRSGIKIAFGVVVCDAIFVVCALFGTAFLPQIDGFELYLTLFGVVLLMAMGIANLFKGTPRLAYPKTRFGNFIYYFSTGFVLNAINPINFITWVTLAAYLTNSLHYSPAECYVFMTASLVGIFATESALAIFAHKLKRFFTPKVVLTFNRVTGIVFIFIALQLAWTRLYDPLVAMLK
ncbi:LysE family translocator [Larkinella arboricola]|uniref:Threonine/homoserine/homoserine lactone efflux protein n=1 Tax=Larkinella arboricola TaxID=643671 RepID=A0A327X4H7_LARAB|nr:LysE family transporter [Larkinella arboricola]RAK00445.1 threonine/homoserine/homoserine lactone efflux protein [Larkinella arboricola]